MAAYEKETGKPAVTCADWLEEPKEMHLLRERVKVKRLSLLAG